MQHDDPFANQSTEEDTCDPFGTPQSQLEQTFTKGFGMRFGLLPVSKTPS